MNKKKFIVILATAIIPLVGFVACGREDKANETTLPVESVVPTVVQDVYAVAYSDEVSTKAPEYVSEENIQSEDAGQNTDNVSETATDGADIKDTSDESGTPEPVATPAPVQTTAAADTSKQTAAATVKPTTAATAKATVKPTEKATAASTTTATTKATVKPTEKAVATPKPTATAKATVKPTAKVAHTHTWKTVTETVHHDEISHYEEQPVWEWKEVCNACGFYADTTEEIASHCAVCPVNGTIELHGETVWVGSSWGTSKVQTGTEKVKVVDEEAYDELITTKTCTSCGYRVVSHGYAE